jgi:hypothetical protein
MNPSWSIFTCRQLIIFRLPLTATRSSGPKPLVRTMASASAALNARNFAEGYLQNVELVWQLDLTTRMPAVSAQTISSTAADVTSATST